MLFLNKFTVLLCVITFKIAGAASVLTTFHNGIKYQFDTDGNAIDLTSGKIDYLGGAYVWYGLHFGCGKSFCGVATYSSVDLQTWKYNGLLFDINTTDIQSRCYTRLEGNCGRPHIVYSSQTEDYVLWVDSGSPGYVTFTSKSPITGFIRNEDRALVGYQPAGPFKAGDFSVHVINGTGYVAYSLIDFGTLGASIWPPFFQSIYVQKLTPDMRNTMGDVYRVVSAANDLVDLEAESPDIFQRGDYFYITASNTCSFCTGTILVVYRSKTLAGPWLRQIISGDTCGGQSTGVLSLPDPTGGPTSYLHTADLFSTAPIIGTRNAAHGHQLQQLTFNSDGSVQDLDCSPSKSVTISISRGSNVSSDGLAVSATDGSGETEPYSVSCNLPQYQLYQTFSPSKSGNLTEIGVNLAGVSPTGNTTITIFRYDNNTNFFTPRYVWETLTIYILAPTNVSQALQVVRIPLNAAVNEGDRLGIAIVTGSVTPLCTMVKRSMDVMFDIDSNTRTLFAIGPGQVSLRGKNGMRPPILILPGQEIKWYARVA